MYFVIYFFFPLKSDVYVVRKSYDKRKKTFMEKKASESFIFCIIFKLVLCTCNKQVLFNVKNDP